jgi:hypothetical protein
VVVVVDVVEVVVEVDVKVVVEVVGDSAMLVCLWVVATPSNLVALRVPVNVYLAV